MINLYVETFFLLRIKFFTPLYFKTNIFEKYLILNYKVNVVRLFFSELISCYLIYKILLCFYFESKTIKFLKVKKFYNLGHLKKSVSSIFIQNNKTKNNLNIADEFMGMFNLGFRLLNFILSQIAIIIQV